MTIDFVISNLTPMLERAGAVVFLPRERDRQRHEVIVDDGGDGYRETGTWRAGAVGFAPRASYGTGENPFRLGTTRESMGGSATWTPEIPESGAYAVQVSYAAGADRSDAARYTIRHAGGESGVLVNQQIGGGTWVYLGTYEFEAGRSGAVTLAADDGRTLSADAVRFGGGMGIVTRDGTTSGKPRWIEGARYYEQFAGAPAFVYNVTGEPDADYVDDYRSRPEWVNWLRGAPFGPHGYEQHPGLGIPVDLSLAWHTDAGIDRDGTVGTLLIYDVPGLDSTRTFPNGVSRLANRDLADGLQTQIVDDLRASWRPDWHRRQLWDRNYSEAARPNVPGALLELLSHQNFEDMRYARDPRFRFDAARSVYKAIGRFLAQQRGEAFVPQPLRPTHLQATLDDDVIRLAWRPQADPLESGAMPAGYVIYTRDGAWGWDAGTPVAGTEARVPVPPAGVVRSYRVAATNAGGESRPSEALAVGIAPGGGRPVLVVDGFDRVAPPDAVTEPDRVGFLEPVGVPDGVDVMTVGRQLVFDPEAEYETDPEPGWGKSASDLETTVIAGNRHDLAAAHGRALLALGRSFVSASDEAVEAGAVRLADYPVVDLALGLERRTPWPDASRAPAFEALPEALRQRLGAYLDGGGALLVSGAHWASDAAADPASAAWVRQRLGVEAGSESVTQPGVQKDGATAPLRHRLQPRPVRRPPVGRGAAGGRGRDGPPVRRWHVERRRPPRVDGVVRDSLRGDHRSRRPRRDPARRPHDDRSLEGLLDAPEPSLDRGAARELVEREGGGPGDRRAVEPLPAEVGQAPPQEHGADAAAARGRVGPHRPEPAGADVVGVERGEAEGGAVAEGEVERRRVVGERPVGLGLPRRPVGVEQTTERRSVGRHRASDREAVLGEPRFIVGRLPVV